MFVDEASITAVGGNGGNGCMSFRREKFVPHGGPNGGDGGHGGAVVLVANGSVDTLLAFRYKPILKSERGRHGEGSDKTGRTGQDLEVPVPVGTVVYDEDRVQLLADLAEPGDRFVAAQGGRGGRGNARFKSSVNQAPTRAEPGREGERNGFRLELKLLADVGLLGFPNAGKSTLISRISAARPKIADYPFTTLTPSLGVVDCGNYRSFVVADIPGLIDGAHEGAGLGLRFLRHVERCSLLLHLVDTTTLEREPVAAVESLNHELECYRAELAEKHQIIVATKADAAQDRDRVATLAAWAAERGLEFHEISSVSGTGLKELTAAVAVRLERSGRKL